MGRVRFVKTALPLSGGMDSFSIAWSKRPDVAVTIDYGQLPAAAEVTASKSLCRHLEIEHYIVDVDGRALASGDMAGSGADVHAPASDWSRATSSKRSRSSWRIC